MMSLMRQMQMIMLILQSLNTWIVDVEQWSWDSWTLMTNSVKKMFHLATQACTSHQVTQCWSWYWSLIISGLECGSAWSQFAELIREVLVTVSHRLLQATTMSENKYHRQPIHASPSSVHWLELTYTATDHILWNVVLVDLYYYDCGLFWSWCDEYWDQWSPALFLIMQICPLCPEIKKNSWTQVLLITRHCRERRESWVQVSMGLT